MSLLDNKTSKLLVKVAPILLIISLVVQFAIVSASNNTNISEMSIPIISINRTGLNVTIPINDTNITQPTNETVIRPINETEKEITPINETVIEPNITKRIIINLKNKQGLSIGHYKLINKTNNIYDLEISSLPEKKTGIKTLSASKEAKVIIRGINNIPNKVNSRVDSYSGKKPDNIEITTDVFAIDSLDIDNATITLPKTGNVEKILRCGEFDLDDFNCLNWEITDIEFDDLGDSIEFAVNEFSAYAGGEIIITKAMHLDSDYSFISDIYEQVKEKDNIWSEPIYENQFVRVTFERDLTAENDITIYVRNTQSLDTYIEVYYKDSDEKITEFPTITEGDYYKVYLIGMRGSHDTFDLKIVNNEEETAYLEFDHIIDPSSLVQYYLTGTGGTGDGVVDQLSKTQGGTTTKWTSSADADLVWFVAPAYTQETNISVQTFNIAVYCNATGTSGGARVELEALRVYDCGTSSTCATQDATICDTGSVLNINCYTVGAATLIKTSCTSTTQRTMDVGDYLGISLEADRNKAAAELQIWYNSSTYSSHFNVTEVIPPDTTVPSFSSNQTNASSTTYNGTDVQLNLTITDKSNISFYLLTTNDTSDGSWANESINTATGNVTAIFNYSVDNFSKRGGTLGWRVWANDTAGNVNVSGIYTLVVQEIPDNTAPTFSNNQTNASATTPKINDVIQLNITVSDEYWVSTIRLATNNSGTMQNESGQEVIASGSPIVTAIFNFTVTAAKNSVIGWQLWANDSSSNANANTSIVRTFVIQNSAPAQPTVTYPQEGKNYSDILYINYSSTDVDGDDISYTIYINNTLNITTSVNVTDWNASDGYYTLMVTANDSSTFSSNSSAINFRLDSTGPTITLGNPINNNWTNSTNVTFYFTPDDAALDVTNCTLVINNVLNQSNRTSITEGAENSIWALLGQGTYNWTVNCTDTVGNIGTNTSVKIIHIDTTKPSISLTAPANNNVTPDSSMTFNFTATDNMATLLNCSIYLNNTLNQTNSSTSNGTATLFNISGIADGTYSWNISCIDNATNINWSSTRSFEINRSPYISSVSDTPDPIKGGDVIAIEPSGVIDPNSDNLRYYCSENSAPTSSNTNCSQGNTVYTSPYSTMNCTFNTQSDTTTHTMYCRVYDGVYYSDIVNTTYTTDSTPPALSSTVTIIPNVTDATTAQTTTLPATFYDRYNDGYINITVTGESGMSCRYYTSDTAYNPSTGTACITNGVNATCQPVVDTQGSDAHNFYISCADNLSNGQSTSQNIDITSLVTDWTAPTTTDDSNTDVQIPTYTITITEADNVDGDPTTYYCTDTTGACSPSTELAIMQVDFTSSNRGKNYLLYYSIDNAGNNQTVQNKTININQLPSFNASWDDAATIKGGATVTITTNSSDADSQTLKLYVCNSTNVNSSGCIDGTFCSNTTGTANSTCNFTSAVDDKTYTWYAYIYDSLNESAANNYSGSYITDSTIPTITIHSPISDTYSQNWVLASIELSEDGDWAGYSLNGAANVSLTNSSPTVWSKKIESLSDGDYNLTFYANDTANNMQNKTINFTIDATAPDTLAPVITILDPDSGSTHTTSYIYLNITINENASWAAYSLDNASNITMTEASKTDWYKNITSITDAVHQIMFYVNDTSNNMGNSSTISFTKDSNAPQYISYNNTPLTPNDTQNVTCYSHWNDTLGLSHATIEENATGSLVNHTIALSGTDDWGNYTITAANLTPGTVQCRAYANDTLGNLNLTSTWTFTVNDVTPPSMNISYTPSSEDDLDPNVLINVSANVSDNVAVSNVTLQYKNSTETSWNNYTMTKVGSTYYGNFTPANTDNYTFRVWANDSSNNINTSSSITVEVKYDTTWTVTPSSFSTVSALLNENATLGSILINVTGEYGLEFDLSYTPATISVYYNDTEPFNLSSGASKNISITATAPSTESSTTVAIKIDPSNASTSPDFTYVNGTFISYTDGPYLYVTITTPTSTDTITQGDTINISTQVKNMGSQDATGTWLKWSLPSDWTNSTGLNKSIGFLGVGETATHAMTATLSSSATTGTITLNVSSGCNENKEGSASVSVTVSAAVTEAEEAAAGAGAGAGGGGGGGIAVKAPFKTIKGKELLETEETLEIVRGAGNSFPIKITNIYEKATIYDVTLAVEGYLSQYLKISPTIIKKILAGQSKDFIVTITSPTYMKEGTYSLDFTITGRLEGKDTIVQSDNTTITILTKKDLVEKRFVTLFIHEVSKEEANLSLDKALRDLYDMKEADFPVTKIEKLLEEAKEALEEKNYKKVKELSEEISLMRKNAFEANRLINEVKEQIRLSEEKGINVDEAKRLLNLAIAAFEREDFETALQRAKDAQLTQILLSKGKFNILWFLKTYWWAVLIAVLILSISGVIAQRKLVLVMIERKLEDLDKEEATINDLMRELQEKTFKKKEISTAEYHKQMYNYEKRLSEISHLRAKLRRKRAGIIKISNEIERLKKEDEEVIEKTKQLQHAYYNKQTINKKQYERRKEEYLLRRTEIEQSIAVLETKLAKKERLGELKAETISKKEKIKTKKKIEGPKKEIIPKKKRLSLNFGKLFFSLRTIKEKTALKTKAEPRKELKQMFTKEQLGEIEKRVEESSKKAPLVEDVLKKLDQEIMDKKTKGESIKEKPIVKEEKPESIIKQPIEEKPPAKEQIEAIEEKVEESEKHKIPTVSELVQQTKERFKPDIKKIIPQKDKKNIMQTLKEKIELKEEPKGIKEDIKKLEEHGFTVKKPISDLKVEKTIPTRHFQKQSVIQHLKEVHKNA